MIVDAPDLINLYCDKCQLVHMFLLDEARADYGPAVEMLIPQSLLHTHRCSKRITVASLIVIYSSQQVHGIHELMLPDQCIVGKR